MAQQDLFGRILTSLHEATLDPARWPDAAGLIDRVSGTHGNALLVSNADGNPCRTIAFWRVCIGGRRYRDVEREYFREYWPEDEGVCRARWLPDGVLVPTSDLYTHEEKKTSATYNEIMSTCGARKGLYVRLAAAERSQVVWILGECTDTRGWTSAQVEAIEDILPHLRHFASIQRILADSQAISHTLGGLLDNGRVGIIQLDRNGRIIEANDSATELLRHRTELLDSSGFLRAMGARENTTLQRLLSQAQSPFGVRGSAGAMTIERPSSRTPLLVHVTPVSGREWDFQAGRVAVLVVVVDPERRSRIDAGLVASALGLTPAESRIAVMLAGGRSLLEIANLTGRSEGTVRWHVKQIFRKQGISRQTELVRRVLALSGLPASPDLKAGNRSALQPDASPRGTASRHSRT